MYEPVLYLEMEDTDEKDQGQGKLFEQPSTKQQHDSSSPDSSEVSLSSSPPRVEMESLKDYSKPSVTIAKGRQ